MMEKPPITIGRRQPELIVEVRWLSVHLVEKQAFLLNHVPHMNCHNEHIAPVCVQDALKIDQAVIENQRLKNGEGRALHIWTGLPKGSMRCLRARSTLQFKPMDGPMPQLPLLIFYGRSRE